MLLNIPLTCSKVFKHVRNRSFSELAESGSEEFLHPHPCPNTAQAEQDQSDHRDEVAFVLPCQFSYNSRKFRLSWEEEEEQLISLGD